MGALDTTADGRGCPTDDELAAFVEHSATSEVRKRIEGHVDGCPDCRAAVGHVASAVATEPRTIDRYRLDAKLGEGGMGVVWRAWDPALERTIAIKLLHPDMHDVQGRERAMREARALARLQHPNVVAVYDVGEHEGDVFIATELVDGEAMDKWQRGKSAREIVAAYGQAARGLVAAHALGLVHRDVKPSNILVSRDGRVRIGDFGLATNAAHSSVARVPAAGDKSTPLPKLTADGELLGTPAYMAPEQRETTDVDARADQYSLCLALAEALLGKMPPTDVTEASLAASGVAAPWAAIARGLSTKPGERFPHIEELAKALDARPQTVDGKLAPSAPRRTGPIAIALFAAGVAGGGIWFATRERTTTKTPVATAPRDAAVPSPAAAPWSWTALSSGPWQLPFSPFGVIVADSTHAIVLGIDRFATVELATGKITESPEFASATRLDSLVRAGDRILLFGSDNDAAAVWQLGANPPTATPVPIPDAPVPDGDIPWATGAIISPDGKLVYVCSPSRVPVVRDAATLAVVRPLPGAACLGMHFTDNTHVVFRESTDERTLDLATGKITPRAHKGPDQRLGPGTLRLDARDDNLTIYDGKTKLRSETLDRYLDEVHWSQGYVVTQQLDDVVIIPLASVDKPARKLELPELDAILALGDTFAVAVSGRSVLRIDLATGRVQKPERNLARLLTVAPRGGTVLACSDKLRVWRDGKVIGTTEAPSDLAVGNAGAPVVLLDYDKVDLWNPETGERERVQDIPGFAMSVARDGDTLVIADASMLLRGTTATSVAPWHRLLGDTTRVTGIDVRNDRIALDADDTSHLVDLRSKTVWSYRLQSRHDGTCGSAGDVELSRDGTTVGISHGGGILILDAKTHVLRELELADHWLRWTFLASGELIAVSRENVIVWHPTTQKAIAWPIAIKERPAKLGVSPDDNELAVGFEDGSLLWVSLRDMRVHAKPYAATLKPASLCAPPPPPVAYGTLLTD